jgi:hypothetical protein
MKSPWPLKPLLALATFGAGITLPQYIPQWYNWRIYEWAAATTIIDFQPRTHSPTPVADEMERLRPDSVPVKQNGSRIVDEHRAMDGFYAALLRTERGQPGAVTRILHYGDSPTTADLITADVRQFLQQRFGDAGHGTYLLGKPWAWYKHRGLDLDSSGWQMDPATLRGAKDGRYGLGGVSFTGGVNASSRIAVKNEGHTRLNVRYFGQPDGGEVEIMAGDIHIGTLDTTAPRAMEAEKEFPIPPEAREFKLKVTRGTVRLFSLEFFKPGDGVVYDSIGLNGCWAGVLAHHMNAEHWATELRAAKPDLVIINYGTNETGYKNYVEGAYPKDVREIIRRVREALPETSLLIMSPMDRGSRAAGGEIGTIAQLPQLVSLQARLAADNDCAFFNTFQAMGGPGTMGKWYMAEPRLVSADFIHPLPAGARIVGTLLYQALMDGYNTYKLEQIRHKLAEAQVAPTTRKP